MQKTRPDWDTYFLMTAIIASTRSTCGRRQVGAVITRENHILSTGYNGAPHGTKHCTDIGCLRQELKIPSGERHEICRGSHAELNAIAQAAKMGVSTNGASILCTHEPCSFCTKAILNAGIAEIIYLHPYPDKLAHQMREEAEIKVRQLGESVIENAKKYLIMNIMER